MKIPPLLAANFPRLSTTKLSFLLAVSLLLEPASPLTQANGNTPSKYKHNATDSLRTARARYAGSASVSPLPNADAPFTFNNTGSLNTARYDHTATLLPNGKVLVAGGNTSSGVLSSAEREDTARGAWTATGSLNTARYNHTATLLPNGKVLVAGGSSKIDSPTWRRKGEP